jgi:hypothetical protein
MKDLPDEIPQKDIPIREIFESEAWESTKAALPLALGKDVYGHAIIADLVKMPTCSSQALVAEVRAFASTPSSTALFSNTRPRRFDLS